MITRTFTTTSCDIMVVDTTTNAVKNVTRMLPEKVDVPTAEKILRKKWNTADGIFVRVNSVKHMESIFGMTEETFLAHAVALDDKRKPIDK